MNEFKEGEVKDARFAEGDMRRYCDKSKCPSPTHLCENDSRCLGSLKRAMPITPPQVKP